MTEIKQIKAHIQKICDALDCIHCDDSHLLVNLDSVYLLCTNKGQENSIVEHSQGLNIREQEM